MKQNPQNIKELKLGLALHVGEDCGFGIKQVWVFALAVIAGVALYIGACLALTHWSDRVFLSNAEPWVRDIYMVKDAINEIPTSKQRVLVFGGSNNLFGFNGAMIEANANVRFINYGTHGGLPINYHIDRIMQHAKRGDVLVFSPTFDAYGSSAPIGDYWYIHNMLSWQKDYRKYITLSQELKSYMANDIIKSIRWLLRKGVSEEEVREFIERNMAAHGRDSKALDSRAESSALEGVDFEDMDSSGLIFTPCQNPHYIDYGYKSIDMYGDFCGQSGSHMLNATNDYFDGDMKVSAFFVQEFARLREFAQANDMRLYLIYPPTMENPSFSLKDPKTMEKIDNLAAQLAAQGIEIVGDFRDFHFERKFFYDTGYHLNTQGVQLRSAAFIKLLHALGIGD
ncbi:hypothetical protein [uncultured Helicobacter sp.]|uniref:hypothetical protein n=1 Tax=uncultured Helicobacter sp. TaxID=175537 RepID=UPI0026388673|nr:hypothetical protein [uncultured Helicobacter sp.]